MFPSARIHYRETPQSTGAVLSGFCLSFTGGSSCAALPQVSSFNLTAHTGSKQYLILEFNKNGRDQLVSALRCRIGQKVSVVKRCESQGNWEFTLSKDMAQGFLAIWLDQFLTEQLGGKVFFCFTM